MRTFVVGRKERDSLAAENLPSLSSHSYPLYAKGYCRNAEVAVSPEILHVPELLLQGRNEDNRRALD